MNIKPNRAERYERARMNYYKGVCAQIRGSIRFMKSDAKKTGHDWNAKIATSEAELEEFTEKMEFHATRYQIEVDKREAMQ